MQISQHKYLGTMIPITIFVVVAILGSGVHNIPDNITGAVEECCNTQRLQKLEAVQLAQERMIQELNLKLTNVLSDITGMTGGKECEAGWAKHGDKCYYFDTTPRIWEAARDACIKKKSQLVAVETFEEDLFITTSLKSLTGTPDLYGYYTSGKEVGPKSWTWMSTGKFMLPYAPWYHREGPGQDTHHDCHIYRVADRMRWYDMTCDRRNIGSICEKSL